MKRKDIRLFLLFMGILYQISFLFRSRPIDLVLTSIYIVGSLTMKED